MELKLEQYFWFKRKINSLVWCGDLVKFRLCTGWQFDLLCLHYSFLLLGEFRLWVGLQPCSFGSPEELPYNSGRNIELFCIVQVKDEIFIIVNIRKLTKQNCVVQIIDGIEKMFTSIWEWSTKELCHTKDVFVVDLFLLKSCCSSTIIFLTWL